MIKNNVRGCQDEQTPVWIKKTLVQKNPERDTSRATLLPIHYGKNEDVVRPEGFEPPTF